MADCLCLQEDEMISSNPAKDGDGCPVLDGPPPGSDGLPEAAKSHFDSWESSDTRPNDKRVPALLVPLDALESFFKLSDKRSFAGLKTIATHDAPEKVTIGTLVRIVYRQDIFRRPARDQDRDVGF